MAKNKVKKKPTAKEIASAIIEINTKVNDCFAIIRELDNVLGIYISMKGDMKKFNKFLEKTVKEANDTKGNEESDKKKQKGSFEKSCEEDGQKKKSKRGVKKLPI